MESCVAALRRKHGVGGVDFSAVLKQELDHCRLFPQHSSEESRVPCLCKLYRAESIGGHPCFQIALQLVQFPKTSSSKEGRQWVLFRHMYISIVLRSGNAIIA